jgi:hypothetical protein
MEDGSEMANHYEDSTNQSEDKSSNMDGLVLEI